MDAPALRAGAWDRNDYLLEAESSTNNPGYSKCCRQKKPRECGAFISLRINHLFHFFELGVRHVLAAAGMGFVAAAVLLASRAPLSL